VTIPAAATSASSSATAQSGTDPPPRDPAKWEYSDAENIVKSQNPDWVDAARRFVVDGDHWQDGEAWIGPQLTQGEEGAVETLQLIEDGFTSRNVLAEVSRRYTNGVIGFEPAWALVPKRITGDDEPNPAEQKLIDEAHAALTDWYDQNGIAVRFWNAVFQMTWASRSPLRLFISTRAFETRTGVSTNGTAPRAARVIPRKATLAEALRTILLDVPSVGNACVYTDPDTQEHVGIYLFKTESGAPRAELTYRLPNGQTVIRVMNGEESDKAEENTPTPVEIVADLSGTISMHQLDRARLLTDQAFQLQRALNLSLSVLPRNVTTSGFLERILINAKLPGKWIDVNGSKTWQPSPITFGSGTTLDLQGAIADDGKGTKTTLSPDVKWREPTPVTGTIEAQRALYNALLEECEQGHITLTAEATPSGRSRAEARADYISSLRTGKNPIDRGGRWLIMAALTLAEHLMGSPGKYTKTLRVRFVSRLSPGPLSIEERTQNLNEWKEGLMSRETVMLRNDIEDPDAEVAQIMAEPAAQVSLAQRQAEALQAWIDAGVGVELAGEIIGLDPDLVARIAKDLFPVDLKRDDKTTNADGTPSGETAADDEEAAGGDAGSEERPAES